MLKALRRWFRVAAAPSPQTHSALAVEAAALCGAQLPGTWVVLVQAAYLPHGGRDRLLLLLHARGGRGERTRTTYGGDIRSVRRTLGADECARLLDELGVRGVWERADHREPIRDGLVASFNFAEGARMHSVHLHCGAHDSELAQLLKFLSEALPIDPPASCG